MLEIYVTDSNSVVHRWVKKIHDLRYSNGLPGGYLTFTATLPRDINVDYDDVQMLNDIIVRYGNKIVWQGFVADTPKQWGERRLITINGLGYYAYGKHFRYGSDYDFVAGGYTNAETVIQKTITDMGANRKISNDYTDTDAGTFTVNACKANWRTPTEIWDEVNKYELYNMGVWSKNLLSGAETSDAKPAFRYKAHVKTTVDYFTDLRRCRLNLSGLSVENLCDRIIVSYSSGSHVERPASPLTSGYLYDRSWPKYGPLLTTQSTSTTDAQQIGDAFLTEYQNLRNKGTAEITGYVTNSYGKQVMFYELEAGKNIRIKDLHISEADMFDVSDVLDGKSTFKIQKVDVDYVGRKAVLQLDQAGNDYEILLARLITNTE